MINDSWAGERRFTVPRLWPRRLRSLHTLVLVLILLLIGWLGWTWYRSSSFVKVKSVSVTGLSGPDVPQIRDALTAAALQMTTLNIDIQRLEESVSEYSYVRALTVSGKGTHGVTIHVAEQVPVAYVQTGAHRQVVDADGVVLPRSTRVYGALPLIPVRSDASGYDVTAPGARAAIAALAAAPYTLIAHIATAFSSSAHGVVVQLRSGPQLYFGPSTQLEQKWDAAVAVLQNRQSVGASYIDVTDPSRPAAGVGVAPTQAAALGLAGGDTTTTSGATTTNGSAAGGTDGSGSGSTGNTTSVGG